MMRLVAAVGLALALVTPRVADACDEFIIESKVFEKAARGGILVRFHASPTKGPAYEAPLVNKKWKFKLANKRAIAPKVKLIAPGLAVVTLPKGVQAGVLVDGERRVAELDAIDEDEPRLDEPEVSAVVMSSTGGKAPSTKVTVHVVGQVPRSAVAIVLANAKGEPMTFGMIEPGQPLVAFETKVCSLVPPDTIEPRVGQKVKAFWVDQFGRVSPRSELVKITEEAPPAKGKVRE
ncbi:MAG: hypothetical protein AB7L94_34075 [Kofleriaceae bacterium]